MHVRMLAIAVLMPLVAGCMGDGGGAKVAAVNLEFDGTGSGDHEDKLNCDADGQLTGSGRVEDGSLHVTVTDGGGDDVFDRTYDKSEEFDFESESLSGESGEWTLRAQRMGDDLVGDDFSGRYTFNLAC